MGHELPTPGSQRTAEPTAQGFSGIEENENYGSQNRGWGQPMGQEMKKSSIVKVFSRIINGVGGDRRK